MLRECQDEVKFFFFVQQSGYMSLTHTLSYCVFRPPTYRLPHFPSPALLKLLFHSFFHPILLLCDSTMLLPSGQYFFNYLCKLQEQHSDSYTLPPKLEILSRQCSLFCLPLNMHSSTPLLVINKRDNYIGQTTCASVKD